jgi:hypothetical protein
VTIRNLRVGKGAAGLRFHGRRVEVLANTTGFEIIHGMAPRPAPWGEGLTEPPGRTNARGLMHVDCIKARR